jgi:hypothetical protein
MGTIIEIDGDYVVIQIEIKVPGGTCLHDFRVHKSQCSNLPAGENNSLLNHTVSVSLLVRDGDTYAAQINKDFSGSVAKKVVGPRRVFNSGEVNL